MIEKINDYGGGSSWSYFKDYCVGNLKKLYFKKRLD